MSDILNKNKATIEMASVYNQNLKNLKIVDNYLIFESKKVDISNFDISLLLGSELPLVNNLSTINPEDFYRIVAVHATTLNTQLQIQQDAKKTENEQKLEALKARNPLLKNVSISYQNSDQGYKEYINIVDSNGHDNVFYNFYNIDLLELFISALNDSKLSDITPEELCDVFKRRCIEVNLKDTYDLANSNKTSEEFANKVRLFEKQNKDQRTFGLGNEENNILIDNNHTITFFNRDEKGNLIKQDFSSKEPTDEDENKIKTEESSQIETEENKEEIVKLISEPDFYNLLNNEKELSDKEIKEIDLFNAYLSELLLYKEYLLPELKAILQRFETLMNSYAINPEGLTQKQQNELKKYYDMLDKKQAITLNQDSLTIDNNIRKLTLRKPDEISTKAGYTRLTIILSVISVSLAIILTTILASSFILGW